MFIGHYAPAFAAAALATGDEKGAVSTVGLGTMFIAAQLIDYAFFGFALAGIENMRISPGMSMMNPMDLYDIPYSHSLLGTFGFAFGFGLLVMLASGNRRAALAGALVVISHWFLDLLVHVPDLTLFGSEPKLGLGLWNHPLIEMPLELILCFGAFYWYLRATRPKPVNSQVRRAWLAPLVLALVLLAVQLYNWFGPQPESYGPSIAWTALVAFTILALLAHWAARQRTA
ncbi:MAG: hypothetical protein AAFX04_01855 [Pseudomonadota bacterium]